MMSAHDAKARLDDERIARLRSEMRANGLDALFLRLPENILYVSGFWPVSGFCAALFPLEGDTMLFVPHGEVEFAASAWTDEIAAFPAGSLDRMAGFVDLMLPSVQAALSERKLDRGQIGHDGGFDLVATPHWHGEIRVPSPPTLEGLRSVAPDVTLRDATPFIRAARSVKSRREIEAIRQATMVASLGLDAARDMIRPGVTEIDVALAVQGRIARATTGAPPHLRRAAGFATVMSGPLSANARHHFNISSDRRLESGDHLTIELGAYVDGYWADLTRVLVVGEPSPRQREIHGVVCQALDAALAVMRPGVRASDVDGAARRVVAEAGYGDRFPHGLGHSIGLQWHESPILHPASDHVLAEGEVYTVEPGIYVDGWGGVRVEDVAVVTAAGVDVVSPYSRALSTSSS